MSPRTAVWVSRGLLATAVVMVLVTFAVSTATDQRRLSAPIVVGNPMIADGPQVLAHIERQIAHGELGVPTDVNPGNIVGFVLALFWLATGSLILTRQPRNLAGWLFTAVGLAWVVGSLGVAVTVWSLVEGMRVPLRGMFAVLGESSLSPVLFLPLLFLLFPDGGPPARWRWVMWLIFAGVAITLVGSVPAPGPLNNYVDAGILYMNPVGIPPLASLSGPMTALGAISILLASLASVLAVRGRYRRSIGEERQQLRWLVAVASLAGALLVLAILITVVPATGEGGPPVFPIVGLAFIVTIALGVPAAYLIAIFRYGLWELDVVIKKAAIALVLTGLLVGLGVLVIGVLGSPALWVETNRSVAVLMGLVAGVLVWPLFLLSRRLARRVVFGRRADPYAVLAEFSGRVGETYATEDILPRMAQVLSEATRAESARVWLRVGGELRPEASWPNDASVPGALVASTDALPEIPGESAFEVRDRGELLGALSVALRASDPMNPQRERLIRDLASQAGLVLRNVRLIEELRASRQRLVAAQDEERRRLERDIHDGVQQQLVALSVRLRLADALIERDRERAHEALAEIQADAGAALEDLRDLARGIYPPLLADQGLVAALRAQARKAPILVSVEAEGIGRYPREVEATLYFCTLEALNNVAKYAEASRARIHLSQADGHLEFSVTDDGRGFDAASTNHGTGLQGMADRLDAIGGSLRISSAPGRGTTVTGVVQTSIRTS